MGLLSWVAGRLGLRPSDPAVELEPEPESTYWTPHPIGTDLDGLELLHFREAPPLVVHVAEGRDAVLVEELCDDELNNEGARAWFHDAAATSELVIPGARFVPGGERPHLVTPLPRGWSWHHAITAPGARLSNARVRRLACALLSRIVAFHAAEHRTTRWSRSLYLHPRDVVITERDDVVVLRFEPFFKSRAPQPIERSREQFAHMSPEQVVGAEVGPASDVFVAASMIYSLILRRFALRRDSDFRTLEATRNVELDPLPDDRAPLAPLLNAMLLREPAERPTAQQAIVGFRMMDLEEPAQEGPLLDAALWPPEPLPVSPEVLPEGFG